MATQRSYWYALPLRTTQWSDSWSLSHPPQTGSNDPWRRNAAFVVVVRFYLEHVVAYKMSIGLQHQDNLELTCRDIELNQAARRAQAFNFYR